MTDANTETEDSQTRALAFESAEFWTDLSAPLDNLLTDRLEAGTAGMLIAAPTHIVAESRDTLPIIGLYTASLREAKLANLRTQLLLVGVCVETRQVLATTAYAPLEELREGASSDDDPGDGITGTRLHFDAFERLDLPRDPGTWIFQLLVRDQCSNRVRVEFGGAPNRYHDAAVEAFLRGRAAQHSPSAIVPALGILDSPLPAFGDDAREAPEVPAQPGIELAAPRVFVRAPEAPCVLTGSFRLPARARDTVDDPERWPRLPQSRRSEGQAPPPTAVLPLTLLTTGSAEGGPCLVRLALPAYDRANSDRADSETSEGGPNCEYTGRFAIDLRRLGGLLYDPQTCFVYAFAGEFQSGATLIGVVTPEMLPPETHTQAET